MSSIVNNPNDSCPVCGEGHVSHREATRPFEHRGRLGTISIYFSICDHCGSETVDDAESILNRRSVIRCKKQIDRIPLGIEIKTMRRAANLTQEQAGALFGGGPVAFSKYENDDLVPDEAMANLLRLAIADISIVDKLRTVKASTTTNAIRLLPQAQVAGAYATWPDMNDDVLCGEVVEEISERFIEEQSNNGDGTWTRVLN